MGIRAKGRIPRARSAYRYQNRISAYARGEFRAHRTQDFTVWRPRAKSLLRIDAGFLSNQGGAAYSRSADKNINIGNLRAIGALQHNLGDGARARMEACSIPADGWVIGRYVAPQKNLNVAALSLWGRIGRRACLWVLHLVTRAYLYVSIILVRALVWRAVTHFPRPMPPCGTWLETRHAAGCCSPIS